MTVRKWHVDKALHSVRSMLEVLPSMTADEVEAALVLESASRRRIAVIRRLIGRAARLNELKFTKSLNERFHHASKKRNSIPR